MAPRVSNADVTSTHLDPNEVVQAFAASPALQTHIRARNQELADAPRYAFEVARTTRDRRNAATFAVCGTPVHDCRKSRSGPTFLITFQPRWIFEGLEADTPRRATARRVIRERLRLYDDVKPSPELGAYGNAGKRCSFRHWRNPVIATEQSSSGQ
ncbi:MAG: YqcI/YcgG family protein [Pseudonocardiaceae bacterium]